MMRVAMIAIIALMLSMGMVSIASADARTDTISTTVEKDYDVRQTPFRGVVDRLQRLRDNITNPREEMRKSEDNDSDKDDDKKPQLLNFSKINLFGGGYNDERALEHKERIEARIANHEERMEKRDERLAEIKKHVSEKALEHITSIMDRLEVAYSKLERLLASIEERVLVASAAGEDVSEIDANIAIAQTALVSAQAAIDAAQVVVAEAAASENPRDHIIDIRAAARTAAEALKDAKRAIFDVITAAREVLGGDARAHSEAQGNPSKEGNETTTTSTQQN